MASPTPPVVTIARSSSAGARRRAALEWLDARPAHGLATVVGHTLEAAHELGYDAAKRRGAVFGQSRTTLKRLAAELAAGPLADRGLVAVGQLPLEALAASIVVGATGMLGRFQVIADRPGLPRALTRTIGELRMEGAVPEAHHDPELAAFAAAYEAALAKSRFADLATVVGLAVEAARERPPGGALVLLDVAVEHQRLAELVAALAARAEATFITVAHGDERTSRLLERALPGAEIALVEPPAAGALSRAQRHLFGAAPAESAPPEPERVEVFSSPGESRECVEIARRIVALAEAGIPFDRQAVALRAPDVYGAHLAEAFARAGIPVHFARGTTRPDPAGRAFAALLACAEDGLSARRFAEYLSLGELPRAGDGGAPPAPRPRGDRWVPPDEELTPGAMLDDDDDGDDTSTEPAAGARTPRMWERLILEAAVIGTLDRWRRRLGGLAAERELQRQALGDDDGRGEARDRERAALAALVEFAIPLLEELDRLRHTRATWGGWIDTLGALATRALRRPARVLSVLGELEPLGDAETVDLAHVRLVLEKRLVELVARPPTRRHGCVYIAPIETLRGLDARAVFVPGLAERMFPQKVSEDPVLPDQARRRIAPHLATNDDRAAKERMLLTLAVGAATERLVVSYPRLETEQARPRTPSFYGLELLRATEGHLPGFEELARRADLAARARVGWPAPADPRDAIDSAEHDLALLRRVLDVPEGEAVGTARYLLSTNEHLARALRFRGRRWLKSWNQADGLVEPTGSARAALDKHQLSARSFSPTALQNFAACPYRFLLYAVHKLAPREEPLPIEEIDPLSKGSLVHESQFTLLTRLRDRGMLPLAPHKYAEVRDLLENGVVEEIAAKYKDRLFPAIDRVWDDSIAQIKADLREWLRRACEDTEWTPAYFELSFGLVTAEERDAHSRKEPVPLDCGIALRGSIDLVEQSGRGTLRATDYKTGKQRATDETVIGGGETLQPVFYALVLEKLFPGRTVESGRLYYCTSVGDFRDFTVTLDDGARRAAAQVARAVGAGLEKGFLPAAPAEGACTYCDYRAVCGPYEEIRAGKKNQERIQALVNLRKHK